jgi:hypothetical protein
LIGSRRFPLESMYANALSGSCARCFEVSVAIDERPDVTLAR